MLPADSPCFECKHYHRDEIKKPFNCEDENMPFYIDCIHSKIKQFLDENIEKTVKVTKESSGTLIGLPYPYTTPCVADSYQEMYYWDTYFTNAGLLLWGKADYVKNNIMNMFYLIGKYGFMPNGNRTFYLNRSQPP